MPCHTGPTPSESSWTRVSDVRRSGSRAPLGVYVHWPYCARICPYCDFNVYRRREIDASRWASALIQDLKGWADRTPDRRLSSLYFGGGTPSLAPIDVIERVIGACADLWGSKTALKSRLRPIQRMPNFRASPSFGARALTACPWASSPLMMPRWASSSAIMTAQRRDVRSILLLPRFRTSPSTLSTRCRSSRWRPGAPPCARRSASALAYLALSADHRERHGLRSRGRTRSVSAACGRYRG